ncbi:MAG: HyaD/HybD family hydrogenase maturation endopeptidase [Bryobacteraceae bacterium]|nr:HyaD/HybD family hydrogenase maturation endopeptidase [Bryobacteraceae bacterium]
MDADRAYHDPDAQRAIAVVGIGNLLLSDDGAGIHAIRALRKDSRVQSMARLIDGGTVGTDLLAQVCGCERLLIVDAVDAGLPPGAMVWMDLNDAGPRKIETRNAHQCGIPELLDDLRLLGVAPRQVVLIGVQPATIGLGTRLSPEVASALPALSAEVVRQLERWASAADAVIFKGTQGTDSTDAVLPGAANKMTGTEQPRERI